MHAVVNATALEPSTGAFGVPVVPEVSDNSTSVSSLCGSTSPSGHRPQNCRARSGNAGQPACRPSEVHCPAANRWGDEAHPTGNEHAVQGFGIAVVHHHTVAGAEAQVGQTRTGPAGRIPASGPLGRAGSGTFHNASQIHRPNLISDRSLAVALTDTFTGPKHRNDLRLPLVVKARYGARQMDITSTPSMMVAQ
jgi:hypothetical protein